MRHGRSGKDEHKKDIDKVTFSCEILWLVKEQPVSEFKKSFGRYPCRSNKRDARQNAGGRLETMLKGCLLAVVLAAVALPAGAQVIGQVGAYGEANGSFVSGNTLGGNAATGPSGKSSGVGGTFGVYYDFFAFHQITVGGDLRYAFEHDGSPVLYGNELNYGEIGLRIAGKVGTKYALRPYVQAGPLRSSTNYAFHTAMHGGGGYGYQVGADVDVVPHIDLRLEYAGGYSGGMGTGLGTTTSLTFNSIQGGFVIWFGR